MIKEIKTEKGEFIIVKVPEDTCFYVVRQNAEQSDLWYDLKDSNFSMWIDLPAGYWQIVGNPFKLSEDQWNEIVPCELIRGVIGVGMEWLYPDYEKSNCDGYETASESGLSLLRSLKVYQVNPHGLSNEVTLVHSNSHANAAEMILRKCQNRWQEAEEQTGAWLILQKIRDGN